MATFGGLAAANVVAYKICTKKLAELRDSMFLIRDMELFVTEVEEVIRQAENIYMP